MSGSASESIAETEALFALRASRPEGPVVMQQRWSDLLFVHWKLPAAPIAATLPRGLQLDTHEGEAWVGIVPFAMERIRPVFLPPMPGLSWFLELNLRTYVRDHAGRPGVWFYSLDATQSLAVWTARRFFHLPYEHCEASFERSGDARVYTSTRRGDPKGALRYAWRPTGEASEAPEGSLEAWLCERYLLFAHDERRDRIGRGRVVHEPYRLQSARLDEADSRLFALAGLPLPKGPPDHVAACPGTEVRIHPLRFEAGRDS